MGLPSEASSTERNMAPTENCLNIEGKYKYKKTLVLHSLEMAMRNFKTQTVIKTILEPVNDMNLLGPSQF